MLRIMKEIKHCHRMVFTKQLRKRLMVTIIFVVCLSIPMYVFKIHGIKHLLEVAKRRIENELLIYPNENYAFIPNIVVPSNPMTADSDVGITIFTQTTIESLHYVQTLAESWNGDISVTVFVYDDQMWIALRNIMLLHKCNVAVRQYVRFHILYPLANPPGRYNATKLYQLDCKDMSDIHIKSDKISFFLPVEYPINIARNIAMMYSATPFVFNLDIDFRPSANLKNEMERFLKLRNETFIDQTILYVIPCFESNMTGKFVTKADVRLGFLKDTIRQFTVAKCNTCQSYTDYIRWLSLPYPSEMDMSYYVNFEKPYEPYYIAERKRLPAFRGLFKGYGRDRFSQVYEAHVNGFKIGVMNNGFVVHDGWKARFIYPEWMIFQNSKNNKAFDDVFQSMLGVDIASKSKDGTEFISNHVVNRLV